MSTYVDPRTSITVIVGTLIGVAILLPFFSSGELKFKDRLNRQEKAEADKAVKLLDEGQKKLLAEDYSAAKETILKGLNRLKELHKKETAYHTNGYLWLGRIAANEEEYDEALSLYNKSLELSDAFNTTPELPKGVSKYADSKMAARLKEINERLAQSRKRSWVGHYCNCHDAIADLYREQKDYQKVVEVRKTVLAFVEKNAPKDNYQRINALRNLANAYGDAGLSREERETRKILREMPRPKVAKQP